MNRRTNLYGKTVGLFFLVFACLLVNSPPSRAAPPHASLAQVAVSTWDRTYHGVDFDSFSAIAATADGGFVATGPTYSGSAGQDDIWVVKLNAAGEITWQKRYGGGARDYARAIVVANDGNGYVVAGYTESFGAGSADGWVIKVDNTGNVVWQKTFGTGGFEHAVSLIPANDGGYLVAAEGSSFGDGSADVWLFKVDELGNIVWQRAYGGSGWDTAYKIVPVQDGGYVFVGYTTSAGAGSWDLWVVKLDVYGALVWQKTFGGSNDDRGLQVAATHDGGYIVAGFTLSFGAGDKDSWVIKLDSAGNVIWQKVYGGNREDWAYDLLLTNDGGSIVGAHTTSFGDGGLYTWLAKLDGTGAVAWEKVYRGTVSALAWAADGGLLVAGDIVPPDGGPRDGWAMKADANGNITAPCTVIGPAITQVATPPVQTGNTNVNILNAVGIANGTSVTPVDTSATTATQCFAPGNQPPVATDDAVTTAEDTPVTINVVANDSDVDGNLNPSSAAVLVAPVNGTVTDNGAGVFTYTPASNFNGNDHFSYQVCDTETICADALVAITITPVNDAPVCANATPDSTLLWPPNHQFATIQINGVTDEEGDLLTVVVTSIRQDEPTSGAGNGDLAPDGQGIGTNTAQVRVERKGNGNGRYYQIRFTANDGHDGACTGTVRVSVPKSMGATGAAVDDGPQHDSTQP